MVKRQVDRRLARIRRREMARGSRLDWVFSASFTHGDEGLSPGRKDGPAVPDVTTCAGTGEHRNGSPGRRVTPQRGRSDKSRMGFDAEGLKRNRHGSTRERHLSLTHPVSGAITVGRFSQKHLLKQLKPGVKEHLRRQLREND